MCRIEVELPSEVETQAMADTSKACVLVSYHGEYQEYLEENNLVDVSKVNVNLTQFSYVQPEVAKQNDAKAKVRKEQAAEKQ
jgi:ATPase subunit of ABC transporter with duplicated ATPase domains